MRRAQANVTVLFATAPLVSFGDPALFLNSKFEEVVCGCAVNQT
jgi:hypothetical protein